jgi:hypothetical protein
MVANTLQATTDLEATDCCVCGVVFALPGRLLSKRRTDGGDFYCPNGHVLVYKKPEVDRLREQLAASRSVAAAERERREAAERSVSAAKGQVTKLKRRVSNGVCPCCNRTFANVARHMATKHPDEGS